MILGYLIPMALALASPAVQAHEVWIERDGRPDTHLSARAWCSAARQQGDDDAQGGQLEVTVPAGDVRVHDDTVFAPSGADDKKEGVAYSARARRSDGTAALPFEIAPVSAGGDRFVVVRDGKPMADIEVTVISPEKWAKVTRTDAQTTFTVPQREGAVDAGRSVI